MLVNSGRVKQVLASMNQEQSSFVHELLGMLSREQQMRLQSEEQHQRVVESMEENHRKIEEQLR